jgi:hypothetical protein
MGGWVIGRGGVVGDIWADSGDWSLDKYRDRRQKDLPENKR